MAGQPEDNPTLARVYKNARFLQRECVKEFGLRPALIIAHHPPRGATNPRGGYVLETGADVTLELYDDVVLGLKCLKIDLTRSMRNHGNALSFRFESVEIDK